MAIIIYDLHKRQRAVLCLIVCISLCVCTSCFSPASESPAKHHHRSRLDLHAIGNNNKPSGRRQWLAWTAVVVTTAATTTTVSFPSNAAPPMAVIAEELGYFPVTNRKGETVMIPKRTSRPSSAQAIDLAKHLQKSGATMYGAYWCPHCARQKELLGQQAMDLVTYVECAPRGYGADVRLCDKSKVDGYPMWKIGSGKKAVVLSGEVSLTALAKASKYDGDLNEDLEQNVPPPLGSASCK